MKIKNIMRAPLLMASLLAALTAGIASAKSYGFVLPTSAMAGSYELKANQRYTVEVNGSQIVIKTGKPGEVMTVPVKAEQNGKKYDTTSVETRPGTDPTGPRIIRSIQLGGSNTRLVLSD